MRALMLDYQLTLSAIMRRASTFSGQVEIVSRSARGTVHRYRYADMIRRAKQFAVALQSLGVRRGDRISTLAWNGHRHLEAYFAIPAIGAVLHTLNPRLRAEELSYIIGHAEDRAIVVDRPLLPLLEEISLPPSVQHIIVLADDDAPAFDAIDYERLLEAADAERFEDVEMDERDAAAMCYTSGTTGRPKGVLYSHRALVLHALNLATADALGIGRRDVILAVVPMFHINGWGLPFAAALVGAKLVLPGPRLDPASLLPLIAAERVTLSGGVPTIWLAALHALDAREVTADISSLRSLAVGGSAVPRSMLQGYKERYGITVLHAWGMTETTSVSTVCRLPPEMDALAPSAQFEWLAKQGSPLPLVEIRVRGESGPVPWDGATMGELEIRGPMVASAYFGESRSPDCFTGDGWFVTGDIVTITPEGCIELRDRSHDLIKSGGEWISSVALENTLMGHAAVAEAAVIAVPDSQWGERPLAAVVRKERHDVSASELRDYLAPHFPRWWLPDRFEFLGEIPRTSTGKFLKSELRARFSQTE